MQTLLITHLYATEMLNAAYLRLNLYGKYDTEF